MDNHQKFLEFNGKNILFLQVDGTYWIAIKPILDALKMDADRSIKTMKKDPILGPERSLQTVQVSKNGKNQLRKMTCLPEVFIYGWIFSLRSDSEELTKYKRSCYTLLYNHFHGTITNRKELLIQKEEIKNEIHGTQKALEESHEQFVRLKNLEKKLKQVNGKLTKLDVELVKQPELFDTLELKN